MSRTGSDLVLVVTPDGAPPPYDEWMDDGVLVYAHARDQTMWPAFAQLDVPLDRLPCAYVLRGTQVEWLMRPCALPPSRVSVVPLTVSRTTTSPPPETQSA